MTTFRGTGGDDTITGGSGNDNFLLWQGGSDTVDGGGGDDTFRMGAALDAGDKLDGGTGKDAIVLNGDYAAGLVLNADTITNIEVMQFAAGHSYNLTLNDGNVAADQRLLVKAEALGAGDTLTFDGSAGLDGKFYMIGGAGNDTLTGGARHDVFDLSHGGSDTAHGGGGNDTFNMGAAFDSGDQIDGGAGTNTLNLDGDYSTALTVSGAMAQNIGTVTLSGDNGYNIVWQSAIGSTLTVDASTVGSGFSVTFDASALTSGDVHFIAGADINTFTGGSGDDVVDLQNAGPYDVQGGDGDDTVNFGANYDLFFLNSADGGAGSNTVTFDGDYSAGITLGPQSFLFFSYGLSDFQTVKLLGDHSYTVTFDDSLASGTTLTGGAALTVDASALGASDHANLDFSLSAAPGFTVTGGAGDDTITFASNFSGSDAIDGGAGNNDTLKLNGDYAALLASLTFGATTMTNFETLMLGAGHDYNITFDDGNIAAGIEFFVDTTALSGNIFTLNDAAETDGAMVVRAGAAFTAADSFIGGTAGAALLLDGDYSGGLVFGATTAQNLTDIELAGGHSYNLTLNAATPAVGASMAVAAAALGAGDTLTVDGSAVTDAHLNFYGGAGDDVDHRRPGRRPVRPQPWRSTTPSSWRQRRQRIRRGRRADGRGFHRRRRRRRRSHRDGRRLHRRERAGDGRGHGHPRRRASARRRHQLRHHHQRRHGGQRGDAERRREQPGRRRHVHLQRRGGDRRSLPHRRRRRRRHDHRRHAGEYDRRRSRRRHHRLRHGRGHHLHQRGRRIHRRGRL